MATTRTDIHRPSAPEFDPEKYECHGVWDLSPEFPNPEDVRHRMDTLNALIDRGYRFGHGSSHTCGHCGHTGLRYVALMAREDVKEFIYVGQDCLEGTFSLDLPEFRALREAAKVAREKNEKQTRRDALYAQYPVLAWLTYLTNVDTPGTVYEGHDSDGYGYQDTEKSTNVQLVTRTGKQFSILRDIAHRVNRYAEASDKQAALVDRLLSQITERYEQYLEREAAKEALVESGVAAPLGKVTVTGTVVMERYDDDTYSPYGGSVHKMIVLHADGWKVWSTVPAAISGDVKVGTHVEFTATLEPAKTNPDPLFVFAKRPGKARVLTPVDA